MWIDIRIRKPTAADGDKYEHVLFLFATGSVHRRHYSEAAGVLKVAWMPIPPFNPPEIPEGWRVIDVETEKKTDEMKFWGSRTKEWLDVSSACYDEGLLYITPIEPKFRPFASAEEFRPFASREWRYKSDHESVVRPPTIYSYILHAGDSWQYSLSNKIFCDGTPFGMKVET